VTRLSVVAVPLAHGRALQDLVDTLLDPTVVPEDAQLCVVGSVSTKNPRVTVLEPLGNATVPTRRMLGLRAAKGDLVAFIEDTTRPNAGWGEAIIALHQRHPRALAIGGTLEAAPSLTPEQQALVALDYGRFLSRTSGVADAVPGNNMSFKRRALETYGALALDGFREAEFVPRLIDGAHLSDGKVRLEAAMGAACVLTDARSTEAKNRWFHGRLYAGNRYGKGHLLARVVRAAATPLLAGALVKRGVDAVRRSGMKASPATFQNLVIMSSAWALGESVGYLVGPGDAERHWQ
jgi:hypothetical protein